MKKIFILLCSLFLLISCDNEDFPPICMTQKANFSSEAQDENSVSLTDLEYFTQNFSPTIYSSRTNRYNISVITNDKDHPLIYAINFEQGGWALVSATKKFEPLLAQSDEGYFDVNGAMPGGLEMWKNNMVDIISNVDYIIPQDSINNYRHMWAAISPDSIFATSTSPLSTYVDHYTDYPVFTSDFTKDDYDRLKIRATRWKHLTI